MDQHSLPAPIPSPPGYDVGPVNTGPRSPMTQAVVSPGCGAQLRPPAEGDGAAMIPGAPALQKIASGWLWTGHS